MPSKTAKNSLKSRVAQPKDARGWKHHGKLRWLATAAVALLLIFWIWHKPLTRAYDAFLGRNPASQLAPGTLANQPAVATTSIPGSSGTQASQTKTGTDTSVSHDSTTSTTSTDATAPTNPTTPATPTTTPTSPSSLNNLLAGVTTGQNKSQLISLAGTTPNTCNLIPLLNEEVCTWLNDGQSVVVTLLNGQVIGKTQVGL